ncbi:hypothetical protein CP03DC29_1019A, partial [Chlamydia psittaci 03DC29]
MPTTIAGDREKRYP